MNSKISCAVAAILGGASFGASAAESAAETTTAGTEELATITVTAQRRSENIQNVPITMQALTSQALQQLSVSTFDDYLKYLPNVTSASNGPGQNEVFMRGLSAGSQATQGSGSTGLWPNVAIYLDNQSGQLPNRNLDVYAADIDRIEVLEGPQGTLFGAGAEAGAIRYITNAPKLDRTEANVQAGYGTTAHGGQNSALTAVLNVPLLTDRMALRAVIYNDKRGGYIDNVPATFTRKNTDVGISYAYLPAVGGVCPDGLPTNGFCVPPSARQINNAPNVGTDINPATYQGIRAELLYKFNDDWDALISQSYQDMTSHGVFYQQPYGSDGEALQPLQVTLFTPNYNKDNWEMTALTINGKFGDIRMVYTGGYLVRKTDTQGDYTNYARGLYADYYQCYGPGASVASSLQPTCFSPSSAWHSTEQNYNLQQELRFSTPDDWRLRAIVGGYYGDNTLYDQTAWMYKNTPPCTSSGAAGTPGNSGCLSNVGTIPGTTVRNAGVQSDNTSFYQDQVRETKQTAVFASIDFDLIPKTLTITAGTRWFEFKNSMKGSVLSSFGCFEGGVPPTGCAVVPTYSFNLDADNLHDTESGFKSRGNLTWHITPDVMVYYTYSQGFRPGGFNQNGGAGHALDPLGVPQYFIPKSYQSDQLTNNEVGWKTELFGHRLQWNGAVYRETWDNVQIEFFNPGVVGNLFYDTNGQNFTIKGLETSLVARIMTGLTLQGAIAWNRSEQTNSPALINNNPASPGYGQPITQACSASGCKPVTNPFGPIGGPSANSPPMQFNVHLRYEWQVGGWFPYVQLGAYHTDHTYTQAGSNPTFFPGGNVTSSRGRFENPAYSTYNAALGVSKDAWWLNLYCENLGNSNASTFISTQQFIIAQTPLRPRVIGGTFGYKF